MEMHEIYLVSSIHISLPIPLNEVNREWAKGTDDERSGSGMGCESKRHGEPRDRRHERDTKWRDEWRVARLSSFMFLVSLTLPLLSPRRAHEWSEWGNETNEERRETEWATRVRETGVEREGEQREPDRTTTDGTNGKGTEGERSETRDGWLARARVTVSPSLPSLSPVPFVPSSFGPSRPRSFLTSVARFLTSSGTTGRKNDGTEWRWKGTEDDRSPATRLSLSVGSYLPHIPVGDA